MAQQLSEQLKIMIDRLNEEQLHMLYRIVAERINLLHKAHALYAMKDFNIMDRVGFNHNGMKHEGLVTRLNQKTITVTLDNGERWGVSPGNLTKVEESPLKEILPREVWEKMNKRK